jgi:flagellar protein FlaI
VRRNKSLTEINHYDAENDEINVQDVYQWSADSDQYETMGKSNTLQKIRFDRGWDAETLERELHKRQAVLSYLVANGLNEYTQVAATLQGFLNDPDAILTMMSNGTLENHLSELRKMESVVIDVDPEKEALVPRPDPDVETYEQAQTFLDSAEADLFADYRNRESRSLATILAEISKTDNVVAEPGQRERLEDMFYGATLLQSDDGAAAARPAESDSAKAVSDGGTDADEGDGAETDDERRDDESRTR